MVENVRIGFRFQEYYPDFKCWIQNNAVNNSGVVSIFQEFDLFIHLFVCLLIDLFIDLFI